MNGALKSKTMWFSLLTSLAGVAQTMSPYMSADTSGKVMIGLGVVGALLRAVTNQSLDEKGQSQ